MLEPAREPLRPEPLEDGENRHTDGRSAIPDDLETVDYPWARALGRGAHLAPTGGNGPAGYLP